MLEAPGSELLGEDAGVLAGLPANGVKLSADLWSLSANADGILDFTVPAATIANVAIAVERGLVHVIGTTGLSSSDDAVIRSVTNRAVVVKSGNMSLGVNLLAALVQQVAKSLDNAFDIEIVEMHHKAKVDAPSGTALLLGEAAAAGRGIALDEALGARPRRPLPARAAPETSASASLRGGTVTGDHSVIFAGPYERITLSHHAEDRMIFAHGALKAALWAHGKKPGLYSMMDVLGLSHLKHDPENWEPVFRNDHAQTRTEFGMSDRLLVLVRHGQSEWNLKNLFTGWKDPDLTRAGHCRSERGRSQVEGARTVFRHRLHLGTAARAAYAVIWRSPKSARPD